MQPEIDALTAFEIALVVIAVILIPTFRYFWNQGRKLALVLADMERDIQELQKELKKADTDHGELKKKVDNIAITTAKIQATLDILSKEYKK